MTFLTGTPLECVIHPDIWHVNKLQTGSGVNMSSANNLHNLIKSLNPSLADTLAPQPKVTSINVVQIKNLEHQEKPEKYIKIFLACRDVLPYISGHSPKSTAPKTTFPPLSSTYHFSSSSHQYFWYSSTSRFPGKLGQGQARGYGRITPFWALPLAGKPLKLE